jgi:hypothetical protein
MIRIPARLMNSKAYLLKQICGGSILPYGR